MSCFICGRQHHPRRLPFLCPVDARNRLYEGRLAQAHTLIESSRLETDINDLLTNVSISVSASAKPPVTPESRKIAADACLSEQQEALDRTDEIIAQADRLRAEVAAARKVLERRRKVLSRRQADMASAANGIAARRKTQLDNIDSANKVMGANWDLAHESTVSTRAFLCMEAARLYGLRRQKKGSTVKYEIGGVEIVDLQSLNSASPEVISTSLAHVAHILKLASHYLAIRLPAEITLPHRDYPRPTIFSLASSYSYRGDVPFPGTTEINAQIPYDAAEREYRQRLPRARPLFLDKPLPILAKDDPAMYSLFIEGVALLAHDVAWACCSQGVPIFDKNSSEDVCNMGRNLYNLLIGNQLHANTAGRVLVGQGNARTEGGATPPMTAPAATPHMMGRYSHGTAHSYLGAAEGSEFVRSFKMPNPIKLADRLKSKLSSDAPNPDWELLEDDAWA